MLHEYQKDDLARAAIHDGCLIAWDTGLGKTAAGLHWAMLRLGFHIEQGVPILHGRCLIAAPASLVPQWIEWARAHLRLPILHCETRDLVAGIGPHPPPGFRIVAWNDLDDIPTQGWDCMILDEAVRMKSTHATISQAVRRFRPPNRLALTATAVKNRLHDIFWLAWWVAGASDSPTQAWPYPGTEEGWRQFKASHCPDGLRIRSPETLWPLLAPWILRRRKESLGMPGATLRTHWFDLDPRTAATAAAGGRAHATLRNLTAGGEAKMAWLKGWIQDRHRAGKQFLIYSALKAPLKEAARIARDITGATPPVADGDMTHRDRATAATAFKQGRIPGLLAGTESMGDGHDFPGCDEMALLTPPWAWDRFIQSLNRIHRITSPGAVTFHILLNRGTPEARVAAMLEQKRHTSETVLDGAVSDALAIDLGGEQAA